MKAIIILVVAAGMHFSTFFTVATAFSGPEKPVPAENTWVKSEKGVWLGGYNMWYKIDQKNNVVKFSHDQKKWKVASNAAWQDKQGRWMYIYEDRLVCNSDGKSWTEVPNNTWQDLNGNWFRFDSNTWQLDEAAQDAAQ